MGEQEAFSERPQRQQQEQQGRGRGNKEPLREGGGDSSDAGAALLIAKEDCCGHRNNGNHDPAPPQEADQCGIGLLSTGSGSIGNKGMSLVTTSGTSTTATAATTTTTTTTTTTVPPPLCRNCNHRHPEKDNMGHFCTEGKQGFWESALAMATLGLVRI